MGKRKILKKLEDSFGRAPDVHYFAEDLGRIAAYFDYRRVNRLDDFLIDDITWNDLDMDAVFKLLNPGLTTCGEQYLYYMLRSPAVRKADYDDRRQIIRAMEQNPGLRLKLQYILYTLGRSRVADIGRIFDAQENDGEKIKIYVSLSLLLILSLAAAIFIRPALFIALILAAVNLVTQSRAMSRIKNDFATLNYSLSMLHTLRKIRKLKDPVIDAVCSDTYPCIDKLRPVMRLGFLGSAASASDNPAAGMAILVIKLFLLDLIVYEYVRARLWRHHGDLFKVHEQLGKMDAAIAIASFKKRTGFYSEPELDFSGDRPAFIVSEGMAHPMLHAPVPNDISTHQSVLITGSNASGKSTYIKTVAVNAILAQSIGVCAAKSYRASAFRIYTSMALKDNLAAGESYYIVETKSLKRVLDAADGQLPVLAVIDEVLRGTNTVERIAASAEILAAMHDKGVVCIAATHDVELCGLLAGKYALFHFDEKITDGKMTFDYTVKPGPAETRNAIDLLGLMGFEDRIVDNAHRRADQYMSTGVWSAAEN